MSESDVVIVTGAAGNLGAALCAVLERRGWRVAPVARDAADLTDPEGAKAVAARTLAAFGRIDGLAHTVGGFAMGSIAEHGPELWDQMRRVNLLTTINMVRAVWPAMQAAGRGSLVAIGAQPALRAGAGMAAYAGAKAAVLRLIEAPPRRASRTASAPTRCCPASSTRRRTAPPCPPPTRPNG